MPKLQTPEASPSDARFNLGQRLTDIRVAKQSLKPQKSAVQINPIHFLHEGLEHLMKPLRTISFESFEICQNQRSFKRLSTNPFGGTYNRKNGYQGLQNFRNSFADKAFRIKNQKHYNFD